MAEEQNKAPSTLALSTKLEEDFVSPLTAIRGALEILRDHPELRSDERERFIRMALDGCGRLGKGIDDLAAAVYSAGQRAIAAERDKPASDDATDRRIRFDEARETVELDLAGLEFNSAASVNAFYDRLGARIEPTGRKWYLLADHTGCSIWPEAWIAFAYRSKQAVAAYGMGLVQFAVPSEGLGAPASSMLSSREDALAEIARLRGKAA